MAFCATCGAPVEGRFCAKCGSTVTGGPAAASAPPPPPGMQPVAGAAPMADNVASALCYALGFITGIIFLVLEPYNRNRVVKFHAFQSIFLSVGVILVRIVLSIVLGMFAFAGGGWMLAVGISSLFSLACFCLWLYVIIMTYQGKSVVLPVIGPLAQKQA